MQRRICALAFAGLLGVQTAWSAPIELLTNGGFETGSFAGWTPNVLAGSGGSLFISTPGTAAPLSGFSTAPNGAGGNFYSLTDQTGPGTYSLTQSFTVAAGATSVILSYQMFANNYAGVTIVDPIGLDHTGPANQHARVDILSAAAGAFDTGAGVLANFFLGADPFASNPNPYTSYSFDITGLIGAGGTFQVRFAEVDNQFFFNQGVDNVSVLADFGPAQVPEPTTLALAGVALAMLGYSRRRRQPR